MGRSHGRLGQQSSGRVTDEQKSALYQVSTSYIERQNLTMRMNVRRLTRLTNAFSKKIENHKHALSLHYMYYNFCRKHQTLTKERGGMHTTPAMAAGVAESGGWKRLWGC